MKKYFKIVKIIIGVIAIVYSLVNDYKYVYELLSALVTGLILPVVTILMRNVKISDFFFVNRHYWVNSVVVLLGVGLFGGLNSLFRWESISFKMVLFIIGTSLILGTIWGIYGKYKLKKRGFKSSVGEQVDILDLESEEEDNDKEGFLSINDNVFLFEDDNEPPFAFKKSDITTFKINREYWLFPTHFTVQLIDGKSFDISSNFPYWWKKEMEA